MKMFLTVLSIICLGFSEIQESPSDYDYQLSSIAQEFRREIMNEEACESLYRDAEDLVDEIDEALDEEDEYTYEDLLRLKNLQEEAEALENFIASVGDCGGSIPSIKQINLANQRVNAHISYVISDKYCVDIVLVEIDDFVSYLAENKSRYNYTVSYKWNALNGIISGEGYMGLAKYSMRQIYNNREDSATKNISIFGVKCVEF